MAGSRGLIEQALAQAAPQSVYLTAADRAGRWRTLFGEAAARLPHPYWLYSDAFQDPVLLGFPTAHLAHVGSVRTGAWPSHRDRDRLPVGVGAAAGGEQDGARRAAAGDGGQGRGDVRKHVPPRLRPAPAGGIPAGAQWRYCGAPTGRHACAGRSHPRARVTCGGRNPLRDRPTCCRRRVLRSHPRARPFAPGRGTRADGCLPRIRGTDVRRPPSFCGSPPRRRPARGHVVRARPFGHRRQPFPEHVPNPAANSSGKCARRTRASTESSCRSIRRHLPSRGPHALFECRAEPA